MGPNQDESEAGGRIPVVGAIAGAGPRRAQRDIGHHRDRRKSTGMKVWTRLWSPYSFASKTVAFGDGIRPRAARMNSVVTVWLQQLVVPRQGPFVY